MGTKEKAEGINEKREHLSSLSREVKQLVATGEYNNINEALLSIYKEQTGAKEFNTFWNWKNEGYQIKKGEKAFLIWSKPRNLKTTQPDTTKDEFKFYGLCYLFSDLQVDKI
jgi:hypothetical protein